MTYEAIGISSTIEEATRLAKENLNAPEDVEVKIEVLEVPVKKTFGLFGGAPAKVKASYEETPAMIATSYLREMLDKMGLNTCKVTSEEKEDGIVFRLESDDYGLIIGRRGETLDALQYLTGLAANRISENYYRVTINTGNYREKRENTLMALAKKNAIQVTRTGKSITLEPMNPYERRIIHTAVQKINGAVSHSIGEDSDRRVVISLEEGFKPTGRKPYQKSGYNKGGYNKGGGRGGYNKGGYHKGGYNKGGYHKSGAGRPGENYKSSSSTATPAEPREPKRDNASAPLYGRIDK